MKTGFYLKCLAMCPETFFFNWHDFVFLYLMCPIMLKYLRNPLRSNHEMYISAILDTIWLELPIFPKIEVFSKFKCYIIIPIVPHYASYHVTNTNKVDHEIWNCINLERFDVNYILVPQEVFLGLFVDLLYPSMLLNISFYFKLFIYPKRGFFSRN